MRSTDSHNSACAKIAQSFAPGQRHSARQVIKAVATLTILLGIALLPAHVWACECGEPDDPQPELQHATAVFSGTVVATPSELPHVEVRDQWPFLAIVASAAISYHVTFAVDRVWKGPALDTLVMQLDAVSVVCGDSFTPGERYLVYAYGQAASLTLDMCGRTTPVAGAQEDFAALGTGSPPNIHSTNRPASGLPLIGAAVCGVGVGSTLIAMLLRRWRRRTTI